MKQYLPLPYLMGIASVTLLTSCGWEEKEKPLNIIYIMTDDHTAQMMSCYDNRYIDTPNLDRIAADGIRFTNSFVANSLSGPSRACMLTGKHSHANGFTDNTKSRFNGEQQTMPKLLQKGGYQTAIIGKWHLGSLPTGFDYWEIIPGQGDYYNPDFITMDRDTIRHKGYLTDIITEKSINWLENSRNQTKPFALFIHHKAAHRNWMAKLEDLPLYEDKTFEFPDNFYDNYENRVAASQQEMSIAKDMDLIYDLKMLHLDKDSKLKKNYEWILSRMTKEQREEWDQFYNPISEDFYRQNLTGKDLANWKFQRYIRDYMKVVKALDDNVGTLLDYLEEHNLLENTLIVYTSDQGFYMGEHGWFDKRFMYEESMRTPLIMRLPKRYNRRGDVKELVQNIDYAPTFLDIAKVDIPKDVHGISLLPLIRGDKNLEWRKSLYYHFYEFPAEHRVKRHYGVRTERYKLIHFYNDIDSWELYDLKTDPKEMNNIYGKKGTQEIVNLLQLELLNLQNLYLDEKGISLNNFK